MGCGACRARRHRRAAAGLGAAEPGGRRRWNRGGGVGRGGGVRRFAEGDHRPGPGVRGAGVGAGARAQCVLGRAAACGVAEGAFPGGGSRGGSGDGLLRPQRAGAGRAAGSGPRLGSRRRDHRDDRARHARRLPADHGRARRAGRHGTTRRGPVPALGNLPAARNARLVPLRLPHPPHAAPPPPQGRRPPVRGREVRLRRGDPHSGREHQAGAHPAAPPDPQGTGDDAALPAGRHGRPNARLQAPGRHYRAARDADWGDEWPVLESAQQPTG